MIATAEDMYRAVLSLINKESTQTMTPDEFNLWANRGQIEYVKARYLQYDQHQKRIDDLKVIITKTDGTGSNASPIPNTGTNTAGEEIFVLPFDSDGDPNYGYMFLLNVSFKIQYQDNKCNTGVSDWLKAKPMHADMEHELNYYERPNDNRLYYQIIGNEIRPITGTNSYATECNIMYLRYPKEIQFVPGGVSVNPEFEPRVNLEIAKWISRGFLESIESPRFQSFTAEDNLTFN
jgi:hypothetical protein